MIGEQNHLKKSNPTGRKRKLVDRFDGDSNYSEAVPPSREPDRRNNILFYNHYAKDSFLCFNNRGDVVVEELSNKLKVERRRLVDKTSFPLTHSGSKILHIGVDPLNNYQATIHIWSPAKAFTMTMTEDEFRCFIPCVTRLISSGTNQGSFYRDHEAHRNDEGAMRVEYTDSHVLYLMPDDIIQIKSNTGDEKLYLATSTVLSLLNFAENWQYDSYHRKIAQGCYPSLESFAEKIVQELLTTDLLKPLEPVIFKVIKQEFNNNPVLYEIYFNYYFTLKNLISRIIVNIPK